MLPTIDWQDDTIVMIDHDMHLVLGVCDVIHVLDLGRQIAAGPPDAIRSDRLVAAAYLGDAHLPQGVAS